MSLSNFFGINLPYGIKKNSNNEWMAFNREYVPLGWNDSMVDVSIHSDDAFADKPIYTKFKGLTENKLLEIAGSEKSVTRNESGEIIMVFLYEDKTNPSSSKIDTWGLYFDKIKKLSQLKR